jgi:hypothetical protein
VRKNRRYIVGHWQQLVNAMVGIRRQSEIRWYSIVESGEKIDAGVQ